MDPQAPIINLPSRFQERTFRQYEPSIALVVTNWPQATRFTPRNSVETFAARFRDSCRSFQQNHWKSELIHRTKFDACYPYFRVSIIGSGVIVSDKRNKMLAVAEPVTTMIEHSIRRNRLNSPTVEMLDAFLKQLINQELEPPIEVIDPSPEVRAHALSYVDQHDVAVEVVPTPTGETIRIF